MTRIAPRAALALSASLTLALLGAGAALANQPAYVQLVNHTQAPARVLWISGQGPQDYGVIEAGQSRQQPTYIGHVWRLTNQFGGKQETVTRFNQTVAIGQPFVDPQYDDPPVR